MYSGLKLISALAAHNSKMDDGRQHENGRHKMDYYRGAASPVRRKHVLPCGVYSLLYYAIMDPFEWGRFDMCSGIWRPSSKRRNQMP